MTSCCLHNLPIYTYYYLSVALPYVVQTFEMTGLTDVPQVTQQYFINYTKSFITLEVLRYPLALWNQWLKESGVEDASLTIRSNRVLIRMIISL